MEAVVPAAGRGSRFLPLTKEQPKELLPVVDKPVIHYVVEEAALSGVSKVLIITGRHKRSLLEDYFDRSTELERMDSDRAKKTLKLFENLPQIYFVRQPEPKGLGDAVCRAKNFVEAKNGLFAVMLGDTINISPKPVLLQLIEASGKVSDVDGIVAVEKVNASKVMDYGIINPGSECLNGKGFIIRGLVEKPAPTKAPSTLGITGTYLLSRRVFQYLEKTLPDSKGEIQLTDALQLMVADGLRIIGYRFDGKRYDIGDIPTWMKANLELTLLSAEYGNPLRKYAAKLLNTRSEP